MIFTTNWTGWFLCLEINLCRDVRTKLNHMNQLVFNLKLNVSQYIREAGAKLRLEEMGRGCYLFNHKELQDTTFSSMSVVI